MLRNMGWSLSPILTGILGALLIHVIGRLCVWIISVSQPDFLGFLLVYLLPAPIMLGTVAGLIENLLARSHRRTNAFWLASITMLLAIPGAFVLNIYVVPDPADVGNLRPYQIYYSVLEIAIGIILQAVIMVLKLLYSRQSDT